MASEINKNCSHTVEDVMNWGSSNKENGRSSCNVNPDTEDYVDPAASRVPSMTELKGPGDCVMETGDPHNNFSTIMVLYCGGTIGMRTKNGVYVPEPNFLVSELKKLPIFHDQSVSLHCFQNGKETPLVMPMSKHDRRIVYYVYEYEPLLDSSNMSYDDYARLATDIDSNYRKFDGFVILHGTDTMAYTASALSFMLENLGKPVILTGSQIPIFELRSDGRSNFINALIIAANYNIPEVAILFDTVLLRGNRTTKVDSEAFDAFNSPNMEHLAKLEVDIHVNWRAVYRHRGLMKFRVQTKLCLNVGVLRLFPSIAGDTVRAFLQPPMKGVVLQTYGQGNGPTARLDIMKVLKDACDRGVIIVNITQCARGSVMPVYAVGQELADIGVIPGCDMTVEAAIMKLSYVLAKDNWSLETKRQVMGENLRGELSVVREDVKKQTTFSFFEKLDEAMKLSSVEEIDLVRSAVFPYLLCAAAHEGTVEALEKLREAGAQLSMSDYDGRSPLHVACCEGHVEVVRYLLDLGAPVHVRDRFRASPLDNALSFKHREIVAMLMATGAHLTLPPTAMASKLCSITVNEDVSVLKMWKTAGADFNVADYSGRTPLHIAVSNELEDKISFLVDSGADPRKTDLDGRTPIDVATDKQMTNILKIMKGRGRPENR